MCKTSVFAIAVAAIALSSESRAAVIYSTVGSTYSQNFNTLPTTPENATLGNSTVGWTDDNATPASGNFSIVGWYLWHPADLIAGEGGFNGHQRLRIGAGTANTGAFMSYGASGSSDRALGMLSSNTFNSGNNITSFYGVRLTNNTGTTLGEFTVSYDGEQWRDGGAATPVAQSAIFGYMVGAPNIQDAGFTTGVTALDFSSPVFANTGAGAAVDGNVAGKVAKGPITVTGISWAPGTDLWLRWADTNDAGNDHALAIDNFNFSANVPEPTTFVLVGLAIYGSLLARKR